jgi:protoporphyrin/coproporphyrin ferrochelatase
MTGILLIQLGTPDAPTPGALRKFLRQFLSDRRVIETSGMGWWLILNVFILPFRPAKSAVKYRRIWHPETGSPLLHYTKRQTQLLQQKFPDLPVRFGMMVGNPSVRSVVKDMIAKGVDRLIMLPMFPQYSATSYAATTDTLFAALMKERRVPAVRVVPPYGTHPAYLDAVAQGIREQLGKLDWTPDHHLISFHGIPRKYAQRGDPYATEVVRTTRGLLERLNWPRASWTQTYQSLFGEDKWLKPYTDDTLVNLAKKGVRKIFVATPGFTSDCLETIDEIGNESAEHFRKAGGEKLYQCPCLNDHPAWIDAMARILREEGQGWM